MASALAHPLFRTSNLDREVHSSAGTADLGLGQYHEATNDSRMPSPLPPGPMFLKDISRSSSSSTQSGSLIFHQPNFHTRTPSLSAGRAEEYQRQQQQRAGLPGLTALASLATNHESQMRSFSAGPAPGMMFNQASSVPTPALAANNMLPVCQNCETSTTPLWRRDESGSVLCNACGLFLKLHGRPRPISLKTDVIKSRNRVKSTQQGPKKQMNHQSLPASQSTSAADLLQNGAHRRVSQMGAHLHPEGSHSPISRTGTPSVHHDPNIAPQHMFDGVSLQDHAFQTPALSALGKRLLPDSLASLNGPNVEAPLSYDQLLAQTTLLKTRVSELEVINMMFQDNVQNLTKERDDALKAQEELKRRVDELEKDQSAELEHASKRPRLDEPIPEQPNEQAPHAPLEQPVLPESSTTADTTGLGEQ